MMKGKKDLEAIMYQFINAKVRNRTTRIKFCWSDQQIYEADCVLLN